MGGKICEKPKCQIKRTVNQINSIESSTNRTLYYF